MQKCIIPYSVKMFQTKDINIWRPDSFPPCWRMFWCLTSIYSQASPVYESEKCLTSIYGNCMSIYGSQTKNKIKSSNVNIFWLEHFYTIRYDTFFHTFLCSTTYQKLTCWSFLCRNPFKHELSCFNCLGPLFCQIIYSSNSRLLNILSILISWL